MPALLPPSQLLPPGYLGPVHSPAGPHQVSTQGGTAAGRETAGEAGGQARGGGGAALVFIQPLPPTPWGSGQVFPSGPQPFLLRYKVERHAFSPQGMPDYENILKRISTGIITN